jgi:integrase
MLTALEVAKLAKPGKHKDGGGLYLQVTTGKAGRVKKSWLLRFISPTTGKERSQGLGTYPQVSLAEVRKRAHKRRLLIDGGIDPIEEGKRQNAAASACRPTFDDCARDYIAAHEAAWRNGKHRSQWTNTLAAYASPVFGSLPVDAITTEHVLAALRPTWTTRQETASRVRQRIERVLSAATAKGYRQGQNPALWKGHLDHLLAKPAKVRHASHFAAMPYADVPDLMARLGSRTGIASKALALLVMTACRTGEVLCSTWAEVDMESRIWVIPAAHTKAHREHRVPLSEPAMAILRNMASIRVNEFIFPSLDKRSRGGLSSPALLKALRRLGETCTVHGFRSAFRDWCGEETSFPREVAEAALAHGLADKTEAAYRRGDALEKRRKLMEAWGAYCGRGARVVALAASR